MVSCRSFWLLSTVQSRACLRGKSLGFSSPPCNQEGKFYSEWHLCKPFLLQILSHIFQEALSVMKLTLWLLLVCLLISSNGSKFRGRRDAIYQASSNLNMKLHLTIVKKCGTSSQINKAKEQNWEPGNRVMCISKLGTWKRWHYQCTKDRLFNKSYRDNLLSVLSKIHLLTTQVVYMGCLF